MPIDTLSSMNIPHLFEILTEVINPECDVPLFRLQSDKHIEEWYILQNKLLLELQNRFVCEMYRNNDYSLGLALGRLITFFSIHETYLFRNLQPFKLISIANTLNVNIIYFMLAFQILRNDFSWDFFYDVIQIISQKIKNLFFFQLIMQRSDIQTAQNPYQFAGERTQQQQQYIIQQIKNKFRIRKQLLLGIQDGLYMLRMDYC